MKNLTLIKITAILFLTSFVLIIPALPQDEVYATGWLTGWGRRQSHLITHAAYASTNYQIHFTVNFGSGTSSGETVYCTSVCRSDFGDVRFTDDDGTTLLDYWLESYTASSTASFWVEEADSLSTNDQTIYWYWDNPSVTTTSNCANTFIFCDTFETDLTSKWTVSGTASLSADYAYGTGVDSVKIGTSTSSITSKTNFNTGNASLNIRYYDLANAGKEDEMMWNQAATTSMVGVQEDINTTRYVYRIGASYLASSVSRASGWHLMTIRVRATLTEVLIDDVLQSTTTNLNSITNVFVGSAWAANAVSQYWDNCYIRKYLATEPAHSTYGTVESLKVYVSLYFFKGISAVTVNGTSIANSTLMIITHNILTNFSATLTDTSFYFFSHYDFNNTNVITRKETAAISYTFLSNQSVHVYAVGLTTTTTSTTTTTTTTQPTTTTTTTETTTTTTTVPPTCPANMTGIFIIFIPIALVIAAAMLIGRRR